MNARRLHRGMITIFLPLIIYVVISGLVIAIYDVNDPHQAWAILGGGPGARTTRHAATAEAVPPPATLAGGIDKALAAAGAMPVASVDYRMTGAIPRLELAEKSGRRATELRFYAATGEPMTPLVADGDPFRPRPAYVGRMNRIKGFHTGEVWGLPAQFLSLLTGGAVIVIVLSGATLYFRTWQARRAAGKHQFFWKAREDWWRRLHRTVAILAALFVLNKAVTGTILAWGEIQVNLAVFHHLLPVPYAMPTPMPPVSDGRLSGDLFGGLQTSFDAARKAAPNARIVAVELVKHDGESKGLVTLGGDKPRILAFDMASGAPVQDSAQRGVEVGNGYFADWHQVVKRMHRGDIVGSFDGRYFDIFFSAALLYLAMSGAVLYGQMLIRRRHAGRTGLFWK